MGQLIATCFVVMRDDGNAVTYDNTIYLNIPEQLGFDESLIRFDNIFDAKKFLVRNNFSDQKITVAS